MATSDDLLAEVRDLLRNQLQQVETLYRESTALALKRHEEWREAIKAQDEQYRALTAEQAAYTRALQNRTSLLIVVFFFVGAAYILLR